jgi:hypothetical protein
MNEKVPKRRWKCHRDLRNATVGTRGTGATWKRMQQGIIGKVIHPTHLRTYNALTSLV